jgi:hypothetical protein
MESPQSPGSIVERRYAGAEGAAMAAYEADRASAEAAGWFPARHKREDDALLVQYEKRSQDTAPWATVAPTPTPDYWVRPKPAPAVVGNWGQVGTVAAQAQLGSQVEVRRYVGKHDLAYVTFQQDAAQMSRAGWFPVSQQYIEGSWGIGAFLLALVACLILVGIFVFIYMLLVKPPGTLVVTYEYRRPS